MYLTRFCCFRLFYENRKTNNSLSLQKYFNNPHIVQQPGIMDALIRGLATQSSQKIDRHYAEDVSSLKSL